MESMDENFSGKVRRQKAMVIYELPQSDNTADTYSEYKNEFLDFLRSLDLEIVVPKDFNVLKYIEIDGIRVEIDFDKCSPVGRNGWTREERQRVVRQVSMKIGYHEKLVIVPINKLIDKALLLKKINDRVAERKQIEEEFTERKNIEAEVITLLFEKYKHVEGFKGVLIKESVINIRTERCYFITSKDGKVIGYDQIVIPEIKTKAHLLSFEKWAENLVDLIDRVTNQIELCGAITINEKATRGSAYLDDDGTMQIV